MGAVTDVVKRYVPASYRAMIVTTDNGYYNANDLQSLADFVQQRVFATVVGATLEGSDYNIEEVELLGMLTTLQFIPAAIEYWGDQLQSESTTGTHEVVSWFDRRADLWKLFDHIKADATQLAIDLGINVTGVRAVVPKVSYGDNGKRILKTIDPQRWPGMRHGHVPDSWLRNFDDPGLA